MTYIPKQGDILIVDLNPKSGHEQADKRPVVVISNNYFNARSSVTLVCPITNSDSGYPMHFPLDSRSETTGFVLCEHVRAIDLPARNAKYKETLSDDVIQAVTERIGAAISI